MTFEEREVVADLLSAKFRLTKIKDMSPAEGALYVTVLDGLMSMLEDRHNPLKNTIVTDPESTI